MPFTISHAVVALAAPRTPLPVAAVAVGSMAPDAVLFAPFLPPYAVTHSWAGVLTIDLAVGLVVLATWWWLVRPAWSRAVPGFRERLPEGWVRPPGWSLRGAVGTVVGLVVGSVTHVLWDAFSHEHAWAVRAIPLLREQVGGYPVWAFVQDASSVLGLAALLVAAAVWWRRSVPRPVPSPGRAAHVVVVASVVVVLLGTVALAARALIGGGGPSGVLLELAFRLPVVVAVVLVVGSVALRVVARSVRAEPRVGR